MHLDASLALGDASDRHPQFDPVPERTGHTDRDQLRAAVEPALLGAAPGGDEPHEAAGVLLVPGRGYVEQDVQERQVAWLGAPVGLHSGREQALAPLGLQVRLCPAVERLGVELGRPCRRPGSVHPHGVRQRVEPQEGREVSLHARIRREPLGRIQRPDALDELHVRALVVGGEGLHPRSLCQRDDAVLRRPDERRPEVDHLAARELVVPRAPAHALTRLEHDHRTAGLLERPGGREAGQPGADDRHVGAAPAHPVAGAIGRRRRHTGNRGANGSGAQDLPAGDIGTRHGRGSLCHRGAAHIACTSSRVNWP